MSVTKRRLRKRNVPEGVQEGAAGWPVQVPAVIKRLMLSRGMTDPGQLDLSMSKMASPAQMKGLAVAASLLADALYNHLKIVIVGDYDCDGATSTALTFLSLRQFGHQAVEYLIPNRFDDGYGLTPAIVKRAETNGAQLIITVDNGVSSIDGVRCARDLGIQIIVTDHHLPGAEMPEADALVNPNQPGCDFPYKSTAGVGVAFYLMCALRKELRDRGWFASRQIDEPNMATFLDIVALGTVADVVGLEHNNRLFVAQGLKRMRAGQCRPGIAALAKIAGRELQHLSSADLGFALGPRLNAAGRLDDMSVGIECLVTDSAERALSLATLLNGYNDERKVIEADMQAQAKAIVEGLQQLKSQTLPWGLSLFDDGWHQGVIGLLASRIKERQHRPVVAFALAGNGSEELRGSARSISGLHIRDALERISSQYPGLIIKFGGHSAAAGLSIARRNFKSFSDAFDLVVKEMLDPEALQSVLLTDGEASEDEIDVNTAKSIVEFGPWGQGFPEPVFEGRFGVYDKRVLAGRHLKLMLSTGSGKLVDAIQFNSEWVEGGLPASIHVAYRMDINRFRGRESLQLIVEQIEATH
jgi:single-stranded-DNA-specific exonuclease